MAKKIKITKNLRFRDLHKNTIYQKVFHLRMKNNLKFYLSGADENVWKPIEKTFCVVKENHHRTLKPNYMRVLL
jgi:hypothetical protein